LDEEPVVGPVAVELHSAGGVDPAGVVELDVVQVRPARDFTNGASTSLARRLMAPLSCPGPYSEVRFGVGSELMKSPR